MLCYLMCVGGDVECVYVLYYKVVLYVMCCIRSVGVCVVMCVC